jgi:hypothetical protein
MGRECWAAATAIRIKQGMSRTKPHRRSSVDFRIIFLIYISAELSSGGVRSRRRRRDAPAAAATDAATTTCASDTGSATASERITRSNGRCGSCGGGHETRGQHRSIEPSRRKSRQKGQGGDRALGMVDRRFFPSRTSELLIFFAKIVLVIFSSKLTFFRPCDRCR